MHCDSASLAIAKSAGIPATLATDENFCTEYGTLEINVAVVDSVDAASAHIGKYGTQHTEAIISENKENVKRFIALADCAAVMVNTSTRFTDGEQMGFGAEIGISNQKLHARGPMGLEAMTTTKQHRVRRAGYAFVRELAERGCSLRFDVATVLGTQLTVYEDAF